ncbi:MAG: hypothetical protein ABIL58_13195 [Pseudomonadota bacterium]
MNLISDHELENGLLLNVGDESIQIAADRWRVRIRFTATVPVADHYGSIPTGTIPPLSEVLAVLGPSALYEKVKDRNFISANDKETVISDIVDTFMKDAAPYLGRATFPGKFILKAFRDRKGPPPAPSA